MIDAPTTPPAVAEIPATTDTTMPGTPLAGIRKNVAPPTRQSIALQLKPCDVDANENPILVYVLANGRQVRTQCTVQVFAAVDKQRLDQIDNADFIVHLDPEKDLVVRLERVKRQDYAHGMVPAELEDVKYATFFVDLKSGFAWVNEYPAKAGGASVRRETIVAIKRALDKADSLAEGTTLPGGYPIIRVSGGVGADCTVVVDVRSNSTPAA